jgi:hypothetical protein
MMMYRFGGWLILRSSLSVVLHMLVILLLHRCNIHISFAAFIDVDHRRLTASVVDPGKWCDALHGLGCADQEAVPPSHLFTSLITMALNASIDGLKGLKFIAGAVPALGGSVTTILDVAIKILEYAQVRIDHYGAVCRITDACPGGGQEQESYEGSG